MEQVAWQKQKLIGEYEAVKKAVGDFMKYMNQSDSCKVFYDRQIDGLMYQDGDGVYLINDLSAGYQSLVWLVFDIAYRMAILNPSKTENIAQTAGIVLIDEIDMHLHPKWQWNIINALRKVFTNVQFIAATHAPILFMSSTDVWIIDIENREVEYSWSHYGLDVNHALQKYQQVEKVNPEVAAQIREFYKLFENER